MTTAFISHVNEDREWAYRLVENLEKNEIDCWRRNLHADGEAGLPEEDANQIKQCDFFLPVFSLAAASGDTLFHEALHLARHVGQSRERKYNFIIPLVIDKSVTLANDKIGADMILFYSDFELGLQNLLQSMERKREVSEHLIQLLIGITGSATFELIARYVPELIDMLAKSLGDERKPPDHNITFCHRQFPSRGGRLGGFLDPDSECGQIVRLRKFVVKKKMMYAPFYVDARGELLGKAEGCKKMSRLKAITLDVPADTALVFIGFGKQPDLEKVVEEFGAYKAFPETNDIIPWAVYGPGKDAS